MTSEFPPQPGGIGNHAYNLALYLSKSGHEVQVIADQRSKTGVEEVDFDKALPFSVIRIKRYDIRILMYLKRLLMTYKRLKNVSCVIATGKFSLWNIALFGSFFKVNKLAVIHGSEVNYKSALLKKSIEIALKRMDHIVAVSNYTKSLVKHLELDVTVIPNGIDVSHWVSDNTKLLTTKGAPMLATVGRVSTRKGQLNVIKHLPALIEQFPEIHYHCVGIPTEAEHFSSVASDLGVLQHVTFHGSVPDDKLKQLLQKTDIFVMLSSESKTGDVEGFGIAILEANMLGVPAIGTIGCGIEDAIDNHKSGVLIEAKSANQLINAIDTIIRQKPQYKSNAIAWAESHDWSNVIKYYLKLL